MSFGCGAMRHFRVADFFRVRKENRESLPASELAAWFAPRRAARSSAAARAEFALQLRYEKKAASGREDLREFRL